MSQILCHACKSLTRRLKVTSNLLHSHRPSCSGTATTALEFAASANKFPSIWLVTCLYSMCVVCRVDEHISSCLLPRQHLSQAAACSPVTGDVSCSSFLFLPVCSSPSLQTLWACCLCGMFQQDRFCRRLQPTRPSL